MPYADVNEDDIPAFAAGSRTSANGCGQAAVACLLDVWGRLPYPAAMAVQEIYACHPPNTPGALLGCTPGHVERMCRVYGLAARRFNGNADGRRRQLEAALRDGRPALVLLDLGVLDGPFLTAHYAIAYASDRADVRLTNMTPTGFGSGPKQRVPWRDFMRAWRCWYLPLPAWRFFGLDVHPT